MVVHSGKRQSILFWSLVLQVRKAKVCQARDHLISVAHGRPQAISLDECDVPRPTLEDFPTLPLAGAFFIAYVDLSLIMGRFTQLEIRNAPSKDHATAIEDYLYRWTKYLPEQLRLNHKVHTYQSIKPYILESRQLNVLYLTTIFLLYRLKTLEGSFPTAAVIAASTLAGVFEDFLARDEVRFLGPCFSFHLLAAPIALLPCYKYPDLWPLAQGTSKP